MRTAHSLDCCLSHLGGDWRTDRLGENGIHRGQTVGARHHAGVELRLLRAYLWNLVYTCSQVLLYATPDGARARQERKTSDFLKLIHYPAPLSLFPGSPVE